MVSSSILTQQHSAVVVPFPEVGREVIPQGALAQLVELRQASEAAAAKVKAAESMIREKLENGAEVEPGLFRAFVKTSERRSVAWKDVAMRLAERCGLNPSQYAANVLAHTKPTTSTSLVVEAK